jgi:CyaY protein
MNPKGFESEAAYRAKIKESFDRIGRAFDSVDPDVVECSVQFGALTLLFNKGKKCILSAQPSVGQLWMALASQGKAYHFDFDAASGLWRDDKGEGIELISFLENFLNEMTGLKIRF